MADRDYTPYQRKVIQRWYRNQDQAREQRLQEIVTDLWLATTPRKREALWARAVDLLVRSGVPEAEARRMAAAHDVEGLAALVQRAP